MDMSNKQSSIDWLISELYDYQMAYYGTTFIPLRLIEQAKAMHKDEVLNFQALLDKHEMDALNNNTILLTREEFYNETFEGGNQ